jgi:hypothetical protein
MQEEIEKALDVEFKKATVHASDQAARDAKKKHVRSRQTHVLVAVCSIIECTANSMSMSVSVL